jgi:hypothetical protein
MATLEVNEGMIVQTWEEGKLFTVSAKRITKLTVHFERESGKHGKN